MKISAFFFKKQMYTHARTSSPSSCSFLFAFKWPIHSPPQRTYFLNDPYFKFARVSSMVYQLLHLYIKHLLLRKTDVLKTCRKSKFLGKKIWRNALALKSKKVQGIFGKTFILTLLSSVVFRIQKHVSDLF